MGTAVIKFRASDFHTNRALIRAFRELVTPSTGISFPQADIIQKHEDLQDPNFAALTIHSRNGFFIKLNGLHAGVKEEGEQIVDLLKYCKFEMEDMTVYSILHQQDISLSLRNPKA